MVFQAVPRVSHSITRIAVSHQQRQILRLVGGATGSARRPLSSSQLLFNKALPSGIINPGEESLIVRSKYQDIEIPEVNLADYVWEHVEHNAKNPALVCGMSGRSYTYEVAYGLSKRFGSALLRMGANKGDVIAMVVPNIPEFPLVFLGSAGVDLTVTTMNPTYRPEEIAKQLENSKARYIVTIGLFLPNIKQACDIYRGIEHIIVIGDEQAPEGCLSFLSLVKQEDGSLYGKDRSCNVHEDVVALPFSSGTTGPPKGVMLTHFNLVANMCQACADGMLMFKSFRESGFQETTVAVLPFFHIYAMELIMIYCLRQGHKIVTLPKFEPESYIKALVTYKPTFLNMVPPLVSFLAADNNVKPSHVSSVKFVTGGAAPFGPTLIEKFMDKCSPHKVVFQEGFGMTESSPLTHIQPLDGSAVLGTCGALVSNTIAKIVDVETREALGPDQEGELLVSGPQVMKGYFNNQAAMDKTVMDGWLLTGDIAKYDKNGQFTIVDRLKELIKVKGLQVSPSELEDLIRRHSGVLDVAVVGVPDERSGELPRAYVIRKNTNVSEQSIIDFVADKVAPHKKLAAGVMFVDSLPKNQTGKILRRELKAQVFKGSFGY